MPIHIRAQPGDYAEACLLPGDPLRATYIAEHYLSLARIALVSPRAIAPPSQATAAAGRRVAAFFRRCLL